MTPYIFFLQKGTLPVEDKEARKFPINTTCYTKYEDRLYQKVYSLPC